MSREIPYDFDLKCDLCGMMGAFDFMGDSLCLPCASIGNTSFGCTQRTYRLKTKEGKWAWIWDDTGEFVEGKSFDTEKEAVDWGNERTKGSYVEVRKIADSIP